MGNFQDEKRKLTSLKLIKFTSQDETRDQRSRKIGQINFRTWRVEENIDQSRRISIISRNVFSLNYFWKGRDNEGRENTKCLVALLLSENEMRNLLLKSKWLVSSTSPSSCSFWKLAHTGSRATPHILYTFLSVHTRPPPPLSRYDNFDANVIFTDTYQICCSTFLNVTPMIWHRRVVYVKLLRIVHAWWQSGIQFGRARFPRAETVFERDTMSFYESKKRWNSKYHCSNTRTFGRSTSYLNVLLLLE